MSVALAKEALEVRRQSAEGWMRHTAPGRTVARVIRGIIDIELADRSMTLAAQEFTSVLPVIILAGTVRNFDGVSESLTDQLGIDPRALTTITETTANAVDSSRPTFAAFGVVGVFMVLLSGTSFARALGRVYGKVWGVPALSVRGWWRWIAVLMAVASAVGMLGRVRSLSSVDWVGPPLAVLGEALVWFLLWATVPYLLTEGRLAGRVLWATAGLTAAGLTAVGLAGVVYLPMASTSAAGKFGELGLVFTTITWMFIQSGVVVAATVIIKALAVDEGIAGRLLRGPTPEVVAAEAEAAEVGEAEVGEAAHDDDPPATDLAPGTLHRADRTG
ncbi:hypothetical protein GCM10023094_29890 [Rhodococcus olei]|uniref:YihY family inner membrane protein n=1 Tax=Rhodococcus olei TaxID=2161675 RepID=A0ABP8P6Y8_9NOCA